MLYSWCKVTVVSVIWGKGLYRVCLPQLSYILTNKRVQWRHAFVACQKKGKKDFLSTKTNEIISIQFVCVPTVFFFIFSVFSRHVHSCFAVETIVSTSFIFRNLTHAEVVAVCVSERGGGGWSGARGVSWAEAHDFFILLIILAQSDPLSTSTALLLIIHTASFHNPISNMTHHSLRLFYLAPECNV